MRPGFLYVVQHAAETGELLRQALRTLATSEAGALIGDVRGAGLFIGVEFVRDRSTLEPATAETSFLCSRLKDRHCILTSIDGPADNVLVIKPPMCFGPPEVQRLIGAMCQELEALRGVDVATITHTPT